MDGAGSLAPSTSCRVFSAVVAASSAALGGEIEGAGQTLVGKSDAPATTAAGGARMAARTSASAYLARIFDAPGNDIVGTYGTRSSSANTYGPSRHSLTTTATKRPDSSK